MHCQPTQGLQSGMHMSLLHSFMTRLRASRESCLGQQLPKRGLFQRRKNSFKVFFMEFSWVKSKLLRRGLVISPCPSDMKLCTPDTVEVSLRFTRLYTAVSQLSYTVLYIVCNPRGLIPYGHVLCYNDTEIMQSRVTW